MPRQSDARSRMIESGAQLFRERGVHGTAFADVLARSGAPRGSVYHHFPGGKHQFSEEVIKAAGAVVATGIEHLLAEHHPVVALDRFTTMWSQTLVDSAFEAGCPLVAAAVEGERSGAARDEAGAAFDRWEHLIVEALVAHHAAPSAARGFATLAIAAIEGAVVVCRAQRSLDALERVAVELRALAIALVGPPPAP